MDRLIVACVQQSMRLPESAEEYREDLRRFLRIAATKRARLVIFPELGGVMVAPPLLQDFNARLLKRAARGRRRRANLGQRVSGWLAQQAAGWRRADMRTSMAALLDVAPNDVWQTYIDLFGNLAREFAVTIVAPSAYLPDPLDGGIRNLAVVFGPNGERLGHQARVMLHAGDEAIVTPGSTWDVIPTEVGSLGLMLGSDVLYPEVGRLLAYQGAEILIAVGACPTVELYQKIRTGALARMQDNQLFGMVSFLVGANELAYNQQATWLGRSAIMAPQELTPRRNGILVEMGNQRSEGVLTAELDFTALKRVWESADQPVRNALPLEQAGQVLAKLYQKLQALPRFATQSLASEAPLHAAALDHNLLAGHMDPIELDELPVISTLTSRWPLSGPENADQPADVADQAKLSAAAFFEPRGAAPANAAARNAAPGRPDRVADDETDEMDALPGSANEHP